MNYDGGESMNVGVIGVGYMGRNHARVLSEMGVLSAISDIDIDKVREVSALYKCKWYVNYEDMVEKEDLDAVIIATPTSSHKDIALRCLEEGLNILIEKPIGKNLKEAKDIIRVSKRKHTILLVGLIERFNPVVILAKKYINQDIITASFKRLGLPPKNKDIDVILDLCIHDLDIARYLLGELKLVNAIGIQKKGILEYISAKFKAGEVIVDIESNRLSPIKIRKFYMLDRKKIIEGNYITQSMDIYTKIETKKYPRTFGEFILRGIQAKKETISLVPKEPLRIELEHFLQCIQENKEPLITSEDVLKVMELSEKIRAKAVL